MLFNHYEMCESSIKFALGSEWCYCTEECFCNIILLLRSNKMFKVNIPYSQIKYPGYKDSCDKIFRVLIYNVYKMSMLYAKNETFGDDWISRLPDDFVSLCKIFLNEIAFYCCYLYFKNSLYWPCELKLNQPTMKGKTLNCWHK